jgi:thioredoxin-like negative regulator of GroEL
VSEFVGARSAASVAEFLDELLAPPRADTLIEELRATGELPELQAALDRGDTEGALALILAAVPTASPDERERLRELAVALFERLGQENPVTVDYRRRLATALF